MPESLFTTVSWKPQYTTTTFTIPEALLKSQMTPASLMPCMYGGGELCSKHGGDGAAAHKQGYVHKFPHVSELGGRPEGPPKSKFVSKKQKYNAGELDPMSSTKLGAALQQPPEEPKPEVPEKALETKESVLGTPIITDLSKLQVLQPKTGAPVYGQAVMSSDYGKVTYAGISVGGHTIGKLPNGDFVHLKGGAVPAEDVGPQHAPWTGLHPDAVLEAPKDVVAAMDSALKQSPHSGMTCGAYFDAFHKKGFHAFIVGGMVRDFVASGEQSKDVDLVSNASYHEVLKTAEPHGYIINNAPWVALVQVGSPGNKANALDMTSLRSMDQWGEHVPGGSGIGGGQKVGGNIKNDCASRDFACNALYYDPINKTMIDPTGRGIADAKNKILSPSFVSDEDKTTWLQNNRLGIRLVKMLMKGYKMSDTLKAVYTPKQMLSSLKAFFDQKGSLHSIAAWTIRQICSDITQENSWGDLNKTQRDKVIARMLEFKDVMKQNGFGEAYTKYMGPCLSHYTGSSKLVG